MSTEHRDSADRLIDDHLSASYAALVADLATTLDLTAGVADAAHPAAYMALTSDLAETLDVDAGLVNIIGPDTAPPPQHRPAPSSYTTPEAQDLHRQLRLLTHPERLELRGHGPYPALRLAVDVLIPLCRARTHAVHLGRVELGRASGDDRSHRARLALDLVRGVARARDLARELDRARVGASLSFSQDLDMALNDFAYSMDLDLDIAIGRNVDRALLHGAGERDLVLIGDFDVDFVYDLVDDLDRALYGIFAFASSLAYGLTRALGRPGLDLDLGKYFSTKLSVANLKKADPPDALIELGTLLAEVGDDFVGADLRTADHHAGDLTGVRWSYDTRWPPSWEDRIRTESVEISPGIFRIRGDNWKHSLMR